MLPFYAQCSIPKSLLHFFTFLVAAFYFACQKLMVYVTKDPRNGYSSANVLFHCPGEQMSDISISFRGSASRDQRDQALLWLLEWKSALPVVQLQDPLQFLIRMLVTVYRVHVAKKW